MQLFIPQKLNLEQLLKDYPPEFTHHIDDFHFVIGSLLNLKMFQKKYYDMEFIPLSSEILQKKVRNYNHCLTYLTEHRVLEIENDGWFSTGRARRFRLSAPFRTSELAPIKLEKTSILMQFSKEQADERRRLASYGYLTKWFTPTLKINMEHVEARLLTLLIRERGTIGLRHAWEKYQHRLAKAKLIDIGIYNLKVDTNIQRFHSTFTSLKKELRSCLTYDGEHLWEIDLKNSQPFFSVLLLNPEFYQKRADVMTLYGLSKETYKRIQPKLPTIISLLSNFSFITLVKNDESEASNDIELYCTLVDKGSLYHYFSIHYEKLRGIKLDVEKPADKDIIKVGVFYSLYSPNRAYRKEYADFKSLFRKHFPTVFKIFSILKKVAYNDLARILQLIESEVMIRRSARILGEKYPELPIFTIHDSIATIREGKDIVYNIVKEQSHSLIGLKPSINVEEWR